MCCIKTLKIFEKTIIPTYFFFKRIFLSYLYDENKLIKLNKVLNMTTWSKENIALNIIFHVLTNLLSN